MEVNIEVTELNGFSVSLEMNTPTLIIVHQDIPGMIARVTDILSVMALIFGSNECYIEKAGEKAIMIIEVDSRDCQDAVKRIQAIPHLHNVNFLTRKEAYVL